MSKILTIDDTGLQKTKLQEAQRGEFKKEHDAVTEKHFAELKEAYGLQNPKSVVDFSNPNFSVKAMREGAYATARKLKEAQAELAFGQLLRAGVQNQFNQIYQAVEVTYDAVVRQVGSNKRQEFYAPLERVGFPKKTQRGESFPETSFKGVDKEVINDKFGMMLAWERELIDDDMTGQIVSQSRQMGENARIQEEAYVWGRICNNAPSFDGDVIPVSSTYATVYATGVPGVSGGIHGNGNGVNATAAARLSQTQIQNGWILAKKMLDQSGRPMLTMPSLLAVSPQDIFFAEILLNSEYNASKASAATGDDGKVGGAFSVNPIKNLVGVVSSRFITDYGAFLIDAGKGFVFQRRDATEVVQENPQSGVAFSQEVFRYKLRSRWQADFIDPKFFINLNSSFASS